MFATVNHLAKRLVASFGNAIPLASPTSASAFFGALANSAPRLARSDFKYQTSTGLASLDNATRNAKRIRCSSVAKPGSLTMRFANASAIST